MQLLFLDMDGVLNSYQSAYYFWRTRHKRNAFMAGFEEICPIAASNLNEFLEKLPECKVVISSTWRLFHEPEEWHEKMAEVCPEIVGRVIGKTPHLYRTISMNAPRGWEINNYLVTHGYTSIPFVIFDDDSDMDKVQDNFVEIDSRIGLTYMDVRKAWKILGFEEYKGNELRPIKQEVLP